MQPIIIITPAVAQLMKPHHLFGRYNFGFPLAGYDNKNDNKKAQEDLFKKWFKDDIYDKHVVPISATNDAGGVVVLTLESSIIFEVILDIVITDSMLAIYAVLMVFFFISLQTGSCFIATVGVAEILFSLPCAFTVYRFVFQVKFFGVLNALCLFIVLAIGADDVFVFFDAYKQSALAGPKVSARLETRLTWTYKRSGLAMAITSATTMAAFLSAVSSPLAMTRAFGIFAALVIFCDYALVMTFFCTCVVVYHNSLAGTSCKQPATCCCACCCCSN